MKNIKVFIRPSLYQKLDFIAKNYKIELGGYLTGETKNGNVYLYDILLPEQAISTVHVNITPRDQVLLRKKYGDKCKKIIGHWHSHHEMMPHWSSEDESNMREIMENQKFFVFIVSSVHGHTIRLSIRDPINIDLENCELCLKSLSWDMFMNSVNKILGKNDSKYTDKMLTDFSYDDSFSDEKDGYSEYCNSEETPNSENNLNSNKDYM